MNYLKPSNSTSEVKAGWAGVALGGTGLWPASTLVALAEPAFPLTPA